MRKVAYIAVGILLFLVTFFLYVYRYPTKMVWQRDTLDITDRQRFIFSKNKNSTNLPILFIGDVMLGRHVETLMKRNGEKYLFGDIEEVLKSHSTIANLEGVIPKIHTQTPNYHFAFSFPSSTPRILKENGITAVSLANNHSMDFGGEGYSNTKKVLEENGITHFGSYFTTSDSYFEIPLGTTTVIVYGINMATPHFNQRVALTLTKKLQEEHPQSYLIAFLHWGEEYTHKQNDVQRRFAHELIDSGVEYVVGSHPHVTQGIEVYKQGIIFYSLGNFMFDQYFSQDVQDSYMLSLRESGKGLTFTLLPIVSNRSRVSLATSTAKEQILKAVADNSSENLKQSIIMYGKIDIASIK